MKDLIQLTKDCKVSLPKHITSLICQNCSMVQLPGFSYTSSIRPRSRKKPNGRELEAGIAERSKRYKANVVRACRVCCYVSKFPVHETVKRRVKPPAAIASPPAAASSSSKGFSFLDRVQTYSPQQGRGVATTSSISSKCKIDKMSIEPSIVNAKSPGVPRDATSSGGGSEKRVSLLELEREMKKKRRRSSGAGTGTGLGTGIGDEEQIGSLSPSSSINKSTQIFTIPTTSSQPFSADPIVPDLRMSQAASPVQIGTKPGPAASIVRRNESPSNKVKAGPSWSASATSAKGSLSSLMSLFGNKK